MSGEYETVKPATTTATMLISLIRMFREGPDVSLKGSPTVSPTTPALWQSEPFPPNWPDSMYFLALSQVPPALAIMMATANPVERPPIRSPMTPLGPRRRPTTIGTMIAMRLGRTISFWAPWVEISTHDA